MKRVINLINQDLDNTLRDKVSVFMIVTPLILAIILSLVILTTTETKLSFAVDAQMEPRVIENLKGYGHVELYQTHEQLIERIERPDNVAGIISEGANYAILLEGNEPIATRAKYSLIMDNITRGVGLANFEHISLKDSSLPFKEYSAIMLVMVGLILGGLIAGLNIVNEKNSHTMRLLSASPLRIKEFILAKGIFSIVLGLIISLATSLILTGLSVDYSQVLIGFLFFSPLMIILTFVIGSLASNHHSIIKILAILMIVYLIVPILSIYSPQDWQFLFYILPNYWMFQILNNVYIDASAGLGYWWHCVLTLETTVLVMLPLLPMLKQRLRLI